MDNVLDNWMTQLRKGLLEFGVLRAISQQPLYGYDIVRRLRDLHALVVSEGTIYPILSRFKRDGLVRTSLVESSEGPARKYYQLTDSGQAMLDRMSEVWEKVVWGIDQLSSDSEKEQVR